MKQRAPAGTKCAAANAIAEAQAPTALGDC